jgi:hypothetical protein
MPEDSNWSCEFTTPITIIEGMTLEVWSKMVSGTYITFQTKAKIDGNWIQIHEDANQSVGKWRGNTLSAYAGQSLQGALVVGGEMMFQSPTFEIDGVRVGGWQ